jgi:hypothetical protein
VRFTNLCASSAIAASLVLSACSGGSGGSQALPSNSQAVAPMAHSAHLTVVGARPSTASCGTAYLTCVTVKKGSPASLELCYNASGGSGCTSGSFPSLTWYEVVVSVKSGKIYKKIVGSFYPNPGNPSEDTITAKRKVKNSHGKVIYMQEIEGCLYTSDCLTGEIGIATK